MAMGTAIPTAECTMHEHLPILWTCNGFLVLTLILSFTGNGTLGAGLPVWIAVMSVFVAAALSVWAASRIRRRQNALNRDYRGPTRK